MGWGRGPYLVPMQLSTSNCEQSANVIELHFVVPGYVQYMRARENDISTYRCYRRRLPWT